MPEMGIMTDRAVRLAEDGAVCHVEDGASGHAEGQSTSVAT
jgi:hypothetical protein